MLWPIFYIGCKSQSIRGGLREVVQAGFKTIEIEGDNLIIIQALRGNSKISWQMFNIIEDVRAWLQQDIHYVLNHIYRKAI